MIVKGIVLIILVFGAFFFLGLKISESINSSAIKLFFFSLYFMTIFSIFNLCLTVYFFIKLKDKKGTQGRKGLQGKPGEPGQIGHCGVGDTEKKSNLLKAIHYKLTQNDATKENSCDTMSILKKYEVSILSKLEYDKTKKLLYFKSSVGVHNKPDEAIISNQDSLTIKEKVDKELIKQIIDDKNLTLKIYIKDITSNTAAGGSVKIISKASTAIVGDTPHPNNNLYITIYKPRINGSIFHISLKDENNDLITNIHTDRKVYITTTKDINPIKFYIEPK